MRFLGNEKKVVPGADNYISGAHWSNAYLGGRFGGCSVYIYTVLNLC